VIRSMTGFGAAAGATLPASVTVKSVNHRFLDLTIHAPWRLRPLEPDLKVLVQSRLKRGKVELSVRMSGPVEEGPLNLFQARAKRVVQALRELKDELALEGAVSVSDVAGIPGLFESRDEAEDLPEGCRDEVMSLVGRALDGLDAMRRAEGESLAKDLQGHLEEVKSCAGRIGVLAEEGKALRSEALRTRAIELVGDLGLDSTRLYHEIVRSVERHDVSEELDRLKSHVSQAEALLSEEREAGKRLDFFSQELMREANTVGSKAPSAEVIQHVVHLKGVIERFREQVQNVE
jgi:uncharacterized protein (TIGR00255 family)